ncbi:energy transducer TonB [Rasiella sp. SM2506]|uniref:energy transducer TonB n=1 Tax=Rasiella sp. SM2506 TaxID=3423914 RepID=UPI003D793838
MKRSSNVCGATTKVPSKRAVKKQINISWNSSIFFQVGLIVSLLAAFFVMELEIGTAPNVAVTHDDVLWETIPVITYTVLKDIVETPKEQPKKEVSREIKKVVPTIASQTFVAVENTIVTIEAKIADTETPVVVPPVTDVATDKVPPATTTILGVEHVPVFPGCEGVIGNEAKIDCMSSKIKAFIGKRFKTENFDYFEPGSVQTIRAFFTIDSNGTIVEIQARAKDKNLEAEAKRVIAKLPLMQPGRQGDTPVNVTYAVPIHFQVRN